MHSRIIGTGSYLPEKVLTNADLEKMVETSDKWITDRTGIRQRHIAAVDQSRLGSPQLGRRPTLLAEPNRADISIDESRGGA